MPTFSKRTMIRKNHSRAVVRMPLAHLAVPMPMRQFWTEGLASSRMILTCPNCSTRYQADATRFPLAGRNVRCAKCAHVWHQLPPPPEPEPELAIVAAQSSAVAPEVPPQFVARSDPPPSVVTRSDPPPAIVTRSEPQASVTR